MPSPEKKSLFTTFTIVMFSACSSVIGLSLIAQLVKNLPAMQET